MGKRAIAPVALGVVAAASAVGWALAGRSEPEPAVVDEVAAVEPAVYVDIVAPKVSTEVAHDGDGSEPDDENCRNGCSLKTHHVPPFTIEQYRAAIAEYAALPPDQVSQPLDTLLFYGERTKELMRDLGVLGLPPRHREFLDRQLARDHAYVSVRFVDEADRVRVAVGPIRVPIGVKRHLHPHVLDDVQSLEVNGTVMRVGLYHLWSRY